jgi:hypothetical protein
LVVSLLWLVPAGPAQLHAVQEAGSTTELKVAGRNGIPSNAGAVAINLTATNTAAPGFLTAYPCGGNIPPTSTLNYGARDTVANSAIVDVGSNGNICVYAHTASDIIVDVQGWFPSTGYTPLTSPARFLDTRTSVPVVPVGGAGDFVVTFDGNAGGERLRQGVYHRDIGSQELGSAPVIWGDGNAFHGGSWTGDHDMACGDPTTQRPLKSESFSGSAATNWKRPVDFHLTEVQYACRDHWMTSMGQTDAYSILWFAPNQRFSRAGQRTVSWDVNVTDLGDRQWWEVSIVPVGGKFLATVDWMADTAGIDAYDSRSVIIGNGPLGNTVNITTEGDSQYTGWRPVCGQSALGGGDCASKANRRTFSITDNGNGTLTVNYGGYFTQTVPGQFPDQFEVYFKAHNYTPDKDGKPAGYTWHWDNIIIT